MALDVFPVIPGHEDAGTVAAFGPEQPQDSGLRIGDVVALHYLDSDPDGPWARLGMPNLGRVTRMGVEVDRALARFVVRPARTLVRPCSHPADRLAVLTDALATPHHAMHSVGRVQPGGHLVVLGIGGIGSGAVQLAAAAVGAEVTAQGPSRCSRQLAVGLGAHHVLEVGSTMAEEVEALTGGCANLVVVCTEARDAAVIAVA